MQKTFRLSLLFQSLGILVILIIAFTFRLEMINGTKYHSPIRNDASEYYSYAINMKHYDTYSLKYPESISDDAYQPRPDKVRPPGYALFLYPMVKFPPNMEMIYQIQFTQVFVDTLTVFVAFLFARILVPYFLALLVAGLVAIAPHLISMNIYILTETIFTFALILYLWTTIKALEKKNCVLLFLSGLLLAVTVLIKPTMNYFVYFIGFMLILSVQRRYLLKVLVTMLLGFAITLSPWVMRNMVTDTGKSNKAVASLKNGSYPNLMYNNIPSSQGIQHRVDPDYPKIKNIREFIPYIADKFSNKPAEYTYWYFIGKPITFFSWNIIAGMGDIYIYPIIDSPYFHSQAFRFTHALMKGLHWLIVISSLLMMVIVFIPYIRKKINNNIRLLLTLSSVLMIYFILVHVVGNPLPRYSIPLIPVQLSMSVYFFYFLYRQYLKIKL